MNTTDILETAPDPTPEENMAKKSATRTFDSSLIDQHVGQAREQGLAIDGENGLLAALTKRAVETAHEDGPYAAHIRQIESG